MPFQRITQMELIQHRIRTTQRTFRNIAPNRASVEEALCALDPETVTLEQYLATGTFWSCRPECRVCRRYVEEVVRVSGQLEVDVCGECLQGMVAVLTSGQPDPAPVSGHSRAIIM